MYRIHHIPERTQQDLCTLLYSPERDLSNPFRIGRFGLYVMCEGIVNLGRDGCHQSG